MRFSLKIEQNGTWNYMLRIHSFHIRKLGLSIHTQMKGMKGINTPERALGSGGVASVSALVGAGYFTLLSRHSLGIGTIKMLRLRSLRWGIKTSWRLRQTAGRCGGNQS